MSHVVEIKTRLLDLEAIEQTCKDLGLTFVRDQRTYAWWGRHAGDYPLPQGFKAEDLGKCEHAIKVPGTHWEIGVARARNANGTPAEGYTLLFDFFMTNGRPILEAVGESRFVDVLKRERFSYNAAMKEAEENAAKCGRFLQHYAANVAINQAKEKGYTIAKKYTPTGALTLTITAKSY